MAHYPDNVMTVLKEAVRNVFWTKKNIRALFIRCQVPSGILGGADWNNYTYHIIDPVLDGLNEAPDGLGPLRRMVQETLQYENGDHLLWMNDGQKRKRDAERSLEHLRLLEREHQTAARAKEQEREERQKRVAEAQRGTTFQSKREGLRSRFIAYHSDPDRRERGYGLEEILYDLFLLFEMEPRGPFRRVGEQIDGAFVHDANPFLLEAKWQSKPTNLADLRDLDGAVNSSLDNTLGLFVSLNGFSSEALDGYVAGNRPRIICMDGAHLMAVLEAHIELPDLLRRLRDLAVQKRRVHFPMQQILSGAA